MTRYSSVVHKRGRRRCTSSGRTFRNVRSAVESRGLARLILTPIVRLGSSRAGPLTRPDLPFPSPPLPLPSLPSGCSNPNRSLDCTMSPHATASFHVCLLSFPAVHDRVNVAHAAPLPSREASDICLSRSPFETDTSEQRETSIRVSACPRPGSGWRCECPTQTAAGKLAWTSGPTCCHLPSFLPPRLPVVKRHTGSV